MARARVVTDVFALPSCHVCWPRDFAPRPDNPQNAFAACVAHEGDTIGVGDTYIFAWALIINHGCFYHGRGLKRLPSTSRTR